MTGSIYGSGSGNRVISTHVFPVATLSLPSDLLARPQGGAGRAFAQGLSPCLEPERIAGNVQLLRTVHTAHGRVDGIPRVRRICHRLEKEFAMAYTPGDPLGASPRRRVR